MDDLYQVLQYFWFRVYIYIVISHADAIMFLWIFKNKDKYLTFQVLHAQKTKLAVKKNIK